MINLLAKLRDKKRAEIIKPIMPERIFYLLETIIDLWSKKEGVTTQVLIDNLYGNPRWMFFETSKREKMSPGLVGDIEYLHDRGYAFCRKEDVFPTAKGVIVYKQVHGKNSVRVA